MKRIIIYSLVFIFAFMDKLPLSLAEKASAEHIVWDSKRRLPLFILGPNFYLEPCSLDNLDHQKLFERIYTDIETMKYWGYGDIRTEEESYFALKRYAAPWDLERLTGGFVVRYQGKAVMFLGIGLFQSAGVGEFYIMADSSVRGKGIATEVMKVLRRWCMFLRESHVPVFVNYVNGKRAPLNTVFATASEENVASIRLMLKSGFQPIQSLRRYKNGFPKETQLFTAPSYLSIKGLKNGELSIIYPNRYMKRKAGFELKVKDIRE